MCTSRFHNYAIGKRPEVALCGFQYVCRSCRPCWGEDRTQSTNRDELGLAPDELEDLEIAEEIFELQSHEAHQRLSQLPDDEVLRVSALLDSLSNLEAAQASRRAENNDICPIAVAHCAKRVKREKRKRKNTVDSLREGKRLKVERIGQLPPEMLSMVWSRCQDSGPRCALDLLVPDWKLCNGENPFSGKAREITQVVTYTRGVDGIASAFSTSFGHDNHIFLPTQSFDDRLLAINTFSHNETVRSFFQDGAQVFQLTQNNLPSNVTGESFATNWRDVFPMRSEHLRSILPFDDEHPGEKRTTPNGQPYIFKLLRHIVVNSPLTLANIDARSMAGPGTTLSDANLEALNNAIDLDRTSHLWLSWSQMPQLESVLLDLRIYSHDVNTDRGFVSKTEIIARAAEMGRHLRLKLLVIAGLQSYCFSTAYKAYKSYTARHVEELDEIDGEPNWVKLFICAVRPGGQLVLVDRPTDDPAPEDCTVTRSYDDDMDTDD
ncbi:hypothetical protein F4821DRAFT_260557 [Hypoxylon rubiginosum]|uniref:Uncharacterized protein n=1 Tax=Hypoxylon rubiginosum TaxID=110542 RepID=A0ACC0CZE7_9PEZI|nr:hypothetical protein F4821DRAFT_260557 [Hypoxylon rubiginosum]